MPNRKNYSDPIAAFWGGTRDGLGAPAWVLMAGMIGFGALGRASGMDIWLTTSITVFLFALPGQVVYVEMMSMGAVGATIAIAVAFTATRFLTMTLTLFPQLHKNSQGKSNYLGVHLLAMSSWAYCMKSFPLIKKEHRYAYFLGIGVACWGVSIPSTAIGFLIAGSVPTAVTYGLLFINPLFFLLTFTEIQAPINRLAIALGGGLGLIFYLKWPGQSLLLSGLIGGTIAYVWDVYSRHQLRLRQAKGNQYE